MQYFQGTTGKRIFAISLDKGEYLLESILKVIEQENIKSAYVASGIATLYNCTMHMVMTTTYPPVDQMEHWDDMPLEVTSISGIIADGIPHLHMTAGNHRGAHAGHLELGCQVLYLAEIVIQEIDGLELVRIPNEHNTMKLRVKES